LNDSEHIQSTQQFLYPPAPCRTWKITDTRKKKLKLHLNGFHHNICCSELSIFDGPNSSFNLLLSRNNQENYSDPVDVESTEDTLFVIFKSNVSSKTSSSEFNISYQLNDNSDDFYPYDYYPDDEDSDYVVLELPNYDVNDLGVVANPRDFDDVNFPDDNENITGKLIFIKYIYIRVIYTFS
jgi:hypothetical protein